MIRFILITLSFAISFTSPAMPNIKFPTLGGVQFWNDTQVKSAWHLQQNVFTGHYRLLNPNKIRQAWGGKDHCLTQLHLLAPPRKPMRLHPNDEETN